MAKRITIMMDEKVDKALRKIQAEQIATSSKSVSYSRVLNETLKSKLKIK